MYDPELTMYDPELTLPSTESSAQYSYDLFPT